MNIIKNILKRIAKIIHFIPYSEWTEEEKLAWTIKHSSYRYKNLNETHINPASGLPMIGCLDSSGSSFGSNNSYDNYHRNQDHNTTPSYSSSYDSFTNRY